jgi:hypothetical protein
MRILYVTSFGPDMYTATGRHLIESFQESGTPGAMLICHEGGLGSQIADDFGPESNRLRSYDLDRSHLLRTWLAANQDIIPPDLGGAAPRCTCADPDDPQGAHVPRCPYQWFNKNASRWFRKIASLEHALTATDADALAWLDCDCRFKRELPVNMWTWLFKDAAVLYHKSPQREVIESGVIAFRMDAAGRGLLGAVIERYATGAFRADERWDDGYQFQRVIERHPEIPSKDLSAKTTVYDFVLPSSPLGAYIDHFKGVHGAVLRLMR